MADEQGQTQQQQQTQATETNGTNETNAQTQTTQDAQQQQQTEQSYSKSELTAILARERKAWQQQQADERKKAEMSEAERLKAEKAEAEKRVTETQTAANARIIKTEARAALADAGVNHERRDYALRMLDLSGIDVDEQGDVDAKALRGAIDALLKDVPELRAVSGGGAAGSEFRGETTTLTPFALCACIRVLVTQRCRLMSCWNWPCRYLERRSLMSY